MSKRGSRFRMTVDFQSTRVKPPPYRRGLFSLWSATIIGEHERKLECHIRMEVRGNNFMVVLHEGGQRGRIGRSVVPFGTITSKGLSLGPRAAVLPDPGCRTGRDHPHCARRRGGDGWG